MIKKLFIYVGLLLTMAACSVEEIEQPSGLNPDGELSVTLAVPEMETVDTRATDENTVSQVTMAVLSRNNNEFVVSQIEPFTIGSENSLGNNQYKLKCQIKNSLRSKSDLKFYFIANAPSIARNAIVLGKTESELKDLKLSSQTNDGKMVMSGTCSLNTIVSGNSIELYRNLAKVSVTNAVKEGSEYKPGNTAYPFCVYGSASESRLVQGAISEESYLLPASENNADTFSPLAEAFYHPTRNLGRSEKARPFMIIKAPFNGTDYYYRVEFEKYDESTKKFTTLNLESNHHYQVMVTEVKGKGYATPAEAALYPSTQHLIMTIINDYSPRSYNMITDGLRELGVSHSLSHNGEPTSATTVEYIYVKLYSPDTSDYSSFKATNVTSEQAWLTFGTPQEQSGTDDLGTNDGFADASFRGRVFRVPVNFLKTKDPGLVTGKIVVTWKGLTREIPVTWTRQFDASELCNVQMTMLDGSNSQKYTASDYWAFLKNTCKGIDTYSNNDSIRNEGLHFPMNYGGTTSSTRWKYEYVVEYKNLNNGQAYDWKIEVLNFRGLTIKDANSNAIVSNGSTSGTVKLKITYDPSVTDISGNPDSYWNYQVGTLRFRVAAQGQQKWADYDIDLYHTGFFDNIYKFRNSEISRRLDKTETDEFLYYEVRKGPEYETSGRTAHYWMLDRNLGATSARYYIEKEGGDAYYGDANAAGGYYSVAAYNKGGDPKIYTNLCPPGYEIPRTEAWNSLRDANGFSTAQSGTYFLAQFRNEDNQYIYFPRARYYYKGAKLGESRAGYYWTGSGALGLEKEERGNWQRYLKFTGAVTSYDNGEVNGYRGSQGYGMAIRCVNTTTKSTTTYRTSFNVAGATHVYLYSEVKDASGNVIKRNPVTTWPGQNIGNYLTMTGEQLFNFVYDSPTTEAEEFYVMFTFVDSNGIWHTMSKGASGNTTRVTTDQPSSALTGWKVVGKTSDGQGWYNKTGAAVNTAIGGNWYCSYTTGKVYYSEGQVVPTGYTVYYTNPHNWGTVKIHYWNADKNNEGTTWPGVDMTKQSDGKWKFTLPVGVTHIIFNNGSGEQTDNITLVKEDNHVYSNNKK